MQGRRKHNPKKFVTNQGKTIPTGNSFHILNQIPEDQPTTEGGSNPPSQSITDKENATPPTISKQRAPSANLAPVIEELIIEDGGDIEMELDEKELARIDMANLEKAYHNNDFLSLPYE